MVIDTETTLEQLSKSDISDLALDSAIQLQRAKTGSEFDVKPLHELAAALRHSAGTEDTSDSVSHMWPGYLDPFERLYRSSKAAEPNSFAQIRDFIGSSVHQIDSVSAGSVDAGLASKLIDFCMQLNLELGRRQWLETRVDDTRRRDPIEACLR